jgi:hypothetical protein
MQTFMLNKPLQNIDSKPPFIQFLVNTYGINTDGGVTGFKSEIQDLGRMYNEYLQSGYAHSEDGRKDWSVYRLGNLYKRKQSDVMNTLKRQFNELGLKMTGDSPLTYGDSDQNAAELTEEKRKKNVWYKTLFLILFLVCLAICLGIFLDINIRTTIRLGKGEDVEDELGAKGWYITLGIFGGLFGLASLYYTATNIPDTLENRDTRKVGKRFGPHELEKRARLYGALYSHNRRPFTLVCGAFFVTFVFYTMVVCADSISNVRKRIDAVGNVEVEANKVEKNRLEGIMSRLESRRNVAFWITLGFAASTAYFYFYPKFIEWRKPHEWNMDAMRTQQYIDTDKLIQAQNEIAQADKVRMRSQSAAFTMNPGQSARKAQT